MVKLQVPVQLDMSDQIPIDLQCHRTQRWFHTVFIVAIYRNIMSQEQ